MYVLLFSLIIFSLLVYMLYSLYNNINNTIKQNTNKKYVQLCPDYWDVVDHNINEKGEITGVECKNTHKLGKCAINEFDTFTFDDDIFNSEETKDLARCQWSKRCDVTWHGYDNLCV